MRFIKNLKGRRDIADALSELKLSMLKDRRKNHRISLLLRILSNEDIHQALSSAYDEIIKKQNTTVNQSCTQGPTGSINICLLTALLPQFLLKSIKELRIGA